MLRVIVPGTQLAVSRFVFGTASLHHVGAIDQQARHLGAAAEAGFSHFDTAPLYGFGSAERAIGLAFEGKSQITIGTKVGLYPPGGSDQGHTTAIARKLGGRLLPRLSRAIADWSVTRARGSFEGSLRRLRREHVELLLLHEPDPTHVVTEEWQRWLETEVASGRVGSFGVAGSSLGVEPLVALDHPLAALVQTQDSLERREANFLPHHGRPLQLTYGYVSGATSGAATNDILSRALTRNSSGAILVSTRFPQRLGNYAQLLTTWSPAE